jgi:hypothetical protein
VLAGAGLLVGASLLLVIMARITGYQPAQPPISRAIARYALRFEDRPDGAVLIYAHSAANTDAQSANNVMASDARLVDTLAPGTGGFVRGVLRGLARERRAEHIGPEAPLLLTRWADGRLSLDDPSTGRHVDLEVFGPTNASAFADILVASDRSLASERSKDP